MNDKKVRVSGQVYKPIGSIVFECVCAEIDKLLTELNIGHDESISQMIVNRICKDGLEICNKIKA